MNYYDLSNPQKAIWQVEEFFKGTDINNICGTLTIKQEVDLDKLNEAINIFVQNNRSFGINLKEENGDVVQYFTEQKYQEYERVVLKDNKEVQKLATEMSKQVFDILGTCLYKFVLFNLENGHGGFIVLTHHIISDAATFALIGTEVVDNYRKLLKNEEIKKKDYSYEDYIQDEKEYMNSDKFLKDEEYWNTLYSDVPEVASIPSTKSKDNMNLKGDSKRKEFLIEKDLLSQIVNFCKRNKLSNFNFFMAIYAIYLSRVSNLRDFVIGTPILNRTNFKEKNTTGMFINTAPLRIKIDNDISFLSFVKQIAGSSLSMLRYQKYPYEMLLKNLRKKENSLPSLYDIMLSYQITKANDKSLDIPYEVEWFAPSTISNGMYIHFHDNNNDENLNVSYDYQVQKYDEKDIDNIHKRILHIVEQVLENENILENDIEIITEDEKNKILYEFNNTKTDYPKNKTIIQLFEEQVKLSPNNIALVFDDKKLTYKELNDKVNMLAIYLRKQNVKHGDIVCMLFDKSIEMIVSILSVLKLGASYLPIDITYPKDRIDYIINDSNSKIILTMKNVKAPLPSSISVLCVDLDNNEIYDNSSETFASDNTFSPEDTAYIMYTSGSTGRPKGVMVKNINVVRLVKNTNFIKFSEHERILQTGSIVFDACTFEIWAALLNGFELYIIKKLELLDVSLFQNYLERNKITILWLTAPLFNQLCESNPSMFRGVKYLLTGGDILSPKHINMVRNANPNLTIINGYGPTENTTFSTCFTIDKTYENTIPIGKPIANSTAYIVSSNGSLLPIGFAGELWVGGDGVSAGYFNNPTLTNEKFIKNPFGDGMIYKTGDLAKWRSDGNIDFIGRIDNQVKIRGFRVELSEINNILSNFNNIKECTTIIRDVQGRKTICSYFTSKDGITIAEKVIKNYLKEYLPSYMIPTYIYQLDSMPLTINGKIDKNRLPTDFDQKVDNNIILPTSKVESIILDVYKSILHVENIGINDNFFEIGGDSISAMKIYIECTKRNLNITYSDVFNFPTVQELAKIVKAENLVASSINKCESRPFYPVSSAQKRMYVSSLMGEDSTLYNVYGGILLDSMPNINKLQNALNEVVSRHESLRTYFDIIDGQIVQKIVDNLDLKINILDVNTNDPNELFYIFQSTFDLNKVPLFNMFLFNLPNGKVLFMIDIHHIIFDGISLNNFLQELSNIYNGNDLPTLDISYKDFAVWENDKLKSDDFKKNKEFWMNEFQGNIPVLNLPYISSRPSKKSFEGKTFVTTLSEELTSKINDFAKANNTTPFMIMLACYYVLLYNYTNQEDIVVGTPVSGRIYKELEPLLGMFVNSLPLRNSCRPNIKFKEFLENIKKSCINAFSHQDYPFDILVNDLKVSKDASRHPLFDTMFTYQNNGFEAVNFGGIVGNFATTISNTSKFDISLEVLPIDNKLQLCFEYCIKLFDEIFASNFAKHYEKILCFVLEKPDVIIDNIPVFENRNIDNVIYKLNEINLDDTKNTSNINLFTKEVNTINYANNSVSTLNDIEMQVESVFKKILPVSNIGIDDNFFDLGGDSLAAINLQIELLKSNLQLTYSDIFEYPTIRTLAEKIASNKG